MLMLALAIIGGLITVVGSLYSAGKAAEKLHAAADRGEELVDSGYYDLEQETLQGVLDDIAADELAADTLLAMEAEELEAQAELYEQRAEQTWEEFEQTREGLLVKQEGLAIAADEAKLAAEGQELEAEATGLRAAETMEAGAEAKGTIRAGAAAMGVTGGGSVLRRAGRVQQQVSRQVGLFNRQAQLQREAASISEKRAELLGKQGGLVEGEIDIARSRAEIEASAFGLASESALRDIDRAELAHEDRIRALGIADLDTRGRLIRAELEELWAVEDIDAMRTGATDAVIGGLFGAGGDFLAGAGNAINQWSNIPSDTGSLATGTSSPGSTSLRDWDFG